MQTGYRVLRGRTAIPPGLQRDEGCQQSTAKYPRLESPFPGTDWIALIANQIKK
ncbi:MAG TPA: hypothetical protein PLY52_11505 [Methanothrix sp.]|uniref:hypothetical protein n=1 Tax=Methanothrix sp. TaxID=90426 RepID=UPI002C4C9B55|nr:hypothetical protein [Methanothrix sp.]MDI9416220.1 hypothetical protein [Euryarchaeota archaeon]HON36918.1 hypothetical protein [Methanothrix sp.]HRU76523.1 hypothetical protein [Methanothrix sp.]